ncbi:MAG: hypothetical protein UR89_C0026G0002 [Candidatus Roizmanbacteria bacterium GW2011_GWA2_35_8]|uniref:Uncharacterized protein n=1 Tax=Candidatus Roizmanbacteria bacterium GW2011_GWA2_35_8 TaxID=1618479 RepID=A0A0G0CWQ7_9BACT|nr:MAG: hypothetical protein UR89_C0026G0002 [Candidatus Roizmanbacteria bacterium GW2011_GWA2_35_8]
MIFTLPYIFSSKKTGYKSNAATNSQSISPTPTSPLTANPKAVMEYWVNHLKDNSSASKYFTPGIYYSDLNEFTMLNTHIFTQRRVPNFYGRQQDYEFLVEIDDLRHYQHSDSLLCSLGNGDFDNPFSFLIFYATRQTDNSFYGNQPNTKLTLYRNRYSGEVEGFLSSWASINDVYIIEPYRITFISTSSFLKGFQLALEKSKIPLTNDRGYIKGCGDYRIKKGLSVFPKGQWWYFAEGALEDAKAKAQGLTYQPKSTRPTLSPMKKLFKDNFEKALARQFPEFKIGPNKIDKDTLSEGLMPFSIQKLNYYIDGGCDSDKTKKGNFSLMYLIEQSMAKMVNPPIYQDSKIEGNHKAVAARSFVNFITSSCTKNNYGNSPAQHVGSTPICIGTCYTQGNLMPNNSLFVEFWPIEDQSEFSSYNGKCNLINKSVKFLIQVDETACSVKSKPALFK